MDEKKRIEEIKNGLKKSVYEEAAKISVEDPNVSGSTEKLSNILDGYVDRIDTIEADNMEELEEELRILKKSNIEVGEDLPQDDLVKQYNDYIHNDLERTIAETVEYTYNLNNKTDDLSDILGRPIMNESVDDLNLTDAKENDVKLANDINDSDQLFEIEATTDLGILEDIVELEGDTLDIASSTDDLDKKSKKYSKAQKKQAKSNKKLATLDYILIVVLIVVFAILIAMVAKINGAF